MNATTDAVLDAIRLELDLASLDLAAAKTAQLAKDTPAVRARLAVCRERVDALLDMWNAARRGTS